jgi:hypothetical protein
MHFAGKLGFGCWLTLGALPKMYAHYNRLNAQTAVHHTHRPWQWKHWLDDGFTLEFFCWCNALCCQGDYTMQLALQPYVGDPACGYFAKWKAHYRVLYSCKVQIATSLTRSTIIALCDVYTISLVSLVSTLLSTLWDQIVLCDRICFDVGPKDTI